MTEKLKSEDSAALPSPQPVNHATCNCHECTQARWKDSLQRQLETALATLASQFDAKAELSRMCGSLRAYAIEHKLGLGGEFLDELVTKECDRLRAKLRKAKGETL